MRASGGGAAVWHGSAVHARADGTPALRTESGGHRVAGYFPSPLSPIACPLAVPPTLPLFVYRRFSPEHEAIFSHHRRIRKMATGFKTQVGAARRDSSSDLAPRPSSSQGERKGLGAAGAAICAGRTPTRPASARPALHLEAHGTPALRPRSRRGRRRGRGEPGATPRLRIPLGAYRDLPGDLVTAT
jgi:hypothetical protein